MTPERWQRIEQLFEHGLEVEPDARPNWLDSTCGEDDDLRREVASLLEANAAAEGFLERPVAGGGRATTDGGGGVNAALDWIGRRFGVYRVVEAVGEGGMSTVLLAERDDAQFRDRVAIKVLRGVPGPLAVQRFERERQILADLDHPNIARLRDGGTLEEGVPYVVMDYVEGAPIDSYCDRQGLDLAERLELFLRVCDAVQAAHRSLIVHRDLKPANILVTAEGEPKLLDFGIAKPLDPEAGQTVTRTLFRAMTPRYASPEQVTGKPITTATDVYSLGVLLYELLTGRPPYEIANLSMVAWQRVIAEVEPPRASQVAESPGTARRLRGDLDTILQSALRKDPARRYGSVEAFADDIRRHLRDLPVRARPDTFRYRVVKLVRRNRTTAALAAALFLLLSGFSVFTALQARRLAEERSKAEESLDFLVDVFRVSDPSSGASSKKAEEISAKEILDQGARRVRSELAGRPEIQTRLLHAVGEAYIGLGDHEQALDLLQQAYGQSRRLLGPEDPETVEIQFQLAGAQDGVGDTHAAVATYRTVVDVRRRRLGLGDPKTLEAISNLALELEWSDRVPEAEAMLREAIEAVQRRREGGATRLGDLYSSLARCRFLQGDYPRAEALYRQALDTLGASDGEESLGVAATFSNLSIVLIREARYEEAIAAEEQAREIWTPILAPDHPKLLASLVTTSAALRELGRYQEAEQSLRHVLEVRRERLDPLNPRLLTTVYNLGQVVADQGRYAEAEPLLREALDGAEEAFGEHGRYVATAANNLGGCVFRLGRLDEAEELEQRSLREFRALYGDDNPRTSWPLLWLGRIALARGDLAEAEERAAEAVAIRRKLLAPDHPDVREAVELLDEVRARRGESAGAAVDGELDGERGAPASDG